MVETPHDPTLGIRRPPPASGAMLDPASHAQAQTDGVEAERLIRTAALAIANGAPIHDLDELVRRNAGRVSHADLMSGRLPSNILGDIVSTVEQAKGAAPFNWTMATNEQIGAYLASRGLSHMAAALSNGAGAPLGSSGSAAGRNTRGQPTSSDYGGIAANFGVNSAGVLTGFTGQLLNSQFAPLGYNMSTAQNVAGILGRQEGLRGAALVARTREVANDTRHGLGLDVNRYAAPVARMGREFSDPMIQHHDLLREAERLRQAGDHEGAGRIVEQYNREREQHRERARQRSPQTGRDVDDVYRGMEQNFRNLNLNTQHRSDADTFAAGGPTTAQNFVPTQTDQQRDANVAARPSGHDIFGDSPVSLQRAAGPANGSPGGVTPNPQGNTATATQQSSATGAPSTDASAAASRPTTEARNTRTAPAGPAVA